MTEKLLTYALGRTVEADDMPAVRTIVRNSAQDNYRFSSLVRGIVTSVPFQMRERLKRLRIILMFIYEEYRIPRRHILKGLGAAVALPFLDAMVPALSTTARRGRIPAPRSDSSTSRMA